MEAEREERMKNFLKTYEKQQTDTESEEYTIFGICQNFSAAGSNFSNPTKHNLFAQPTAIVAVVLGSLAIVANLASLCAMTKIRPRLSANQRMIVSLTLSDLILSAAVIAWLLGLHVNSFAVVPCDSYVGAICTHLITVAVLMSGHIISLLNLTCLAFDHFVAINKPLQYPRVLTRKHVSMLLAGMWLIAFVFGFTKFWMPASSYNYCASQEYNSYCFRTYCSAYEPEYLLFALVFITFGFMGFFYTNIYITISKYQSISIRQERRVRRNVKGLVTTIIILVTFLICWLPYCLFEMALIINIRVDHTAVISTLQIKVDASYYLHYLILLNGICDPVIYALRMRDVRRGYYQMVQCKPEHIATMNGHRMVRLTSTRESEQALRAYDTRRSTEIRRISEPRKTMESRLSVDLLKENSKGLCIPETNL